MEMRPALFKSSVLAHTTLHHGKIVLPPMGTCGGEDACWAACRTPSRSSDSLSG